MNEKLRTAKLIRPDSMKYEIYTNAKYIFCFFDDNNGYCSVIFLSIELNSTYINSKKQQK